MEINQIIGKYPYPRKVRHHASANLYLPLNELEYVPLYYPPLINKETVQESFLNKKLPAALDVGCGKSRFLLEYALKNPLTNILGLELRKALVEWALNVIKSEEIPNAWVFWYSAVNGLDFLDDNSLHSVFYLFPDPWPKKKQQRRRLFSTSFLQNVFNKLSKNGKLYLATDCDYVDEYHRRILSESQLFDYYVPEGDEWQLPTTNKEIFCLKNNIPIYRLICVPKK